MNEVIMEVVTCFIIAGICFFFGYKFSKGKWLSIIAGSNTFLNNAKPETDLNKAKLETDVPYINGKLVSRVICCLGGLEVVIGIKKLIEEKSPDFLWIISILIGIFIVLVALNFVIMLIKSKRIG